MPRSDNYGPWIRAPQGQAAAKSLGAIAASRIGTERDRATTVFGRPFVIDKTGTVVAEAPQYEEAVVQASPDTGRMTERRHRPGSSAIAGPTFTAR